jgi:ethanolamine utilization protein EutN
MFLAKIVGNIWATRKIKILQDKKLFLIQEMEPLTGKTHGKVVLATCGEKIDAGIGDTVLVVDEGSSAQDHFNTPPTAIRTFIFGVVDQVRMKDSIALYT